MVPTDSAARAKGGEKRSRVPIVGILGGIGSGKSSVAALLQTQGGALIDADALAHQALRKADVKTRIRDRWGDPVFTAEGEVDRKILAEKVFRQAAELEQLNEIIHPRVREAIRERIAELIDAEECRFIVLDAPLLMESGLDAICTVLIFVDTSRANRIERLNVRRKWDLKELEQRENFQVPLNEKRAKADYTIDNNRSMHETSEQLEAICRDIADSSSRTPDG